MRCHLGFFFELSAARSFLCPLLMKYTLASGKQALPSISASGIKRRISFGISVGIGFVRVSFMYFPRPAGKRHNRVIGYNRSWRRRNKGARREELPSGRGKAVLLCRLRAGAGMSRSAVVGQGKDCSNLPPSDENGLSLAPAARNVRAAVCVLGRSLPSGKPHPAAVSGRTVLCASAGRFCRRPSFCRIAGGGETILFQNYHNKSTRICQ